MSDYAMKTKINVVVFLLLALPALASDWYVTTNGTGNGTSWEDATNSIQGAVDGKPDGDVVWLGAGSYSPATNIVVTNAIHIRSASGLPTSVTVNGGLSYRVFTLASGAWVSGVTITGGLLDSTDQGHGAGVYGGSISNCIVTYTRCPGGSSGGGLYSVTAYSSLIWDNDCGGWGGGALDSTLYSCTIVGNEAAATGGGANGGTVWNCIISGNLPDDLHDVTDYYSCATNATGPGSITNNPLFVGGSDYRLQADSPCINAGTNQAWMTDAKDLDGNERLWPRGGTVDVGCYERGSSATYPKHYLFRAP